MSYDAPRLEPVLAAEAARKIKLCLAFLRGAIRDALQPPQEPEPYTRYGGFVDILGHALLFFHETRRASNIDKQRNYDPSSVLQKQIIAEEIARIIDLLI